jgi:hypothetical protein
MLRMTWEWEFQFKGKKLVGQLRTTWLSHILEDIKKMRRRQRNSRRRRNSCQIKLGRKYMYNVTFEVCSDISCVKLMNGIDMLHSHDNSSL